MFPTVCVSVPHRVIILPFPCKPILILCTNCALKIGKMIGALYFGNIVWFWCNVSCELSDIFASSWHNVLSNNAEYTLAHPRISFGKWKKILMSVWKYCILSLSLANWMGAVATSCYPKLRRCVSVGGCVMLVMIMRVGGGGASSSQQLTISLYALREKTNAKWFESAWFMSNQNEFWISSSLTLFKFFEQLGGSDWRKTGVTTVSCLSSRRGCCGSTIVRIHREIWEIFYFPFRTNHLPLVLSLFRFKNIRIKKQSYYYCYYLVGYAK